jgi:hypothetical protein
MPYGVVAQGTARIRLVCPQGLRLALFWPGQVPLATAGLPRELL